MGVLNSFFSIPPKSAVQSVDNTKYEKQILAYLHPVITICRLFGVFPFQLIEHSGTLSLKHNRRGWLIYSILIWLIATGYVGFQAVSLVICISRGHSIIQLSAQSLWFNSPLIAYVVCIFLFFRGYKLVEIFEDWCAIEKDLERLFCPIKTRDHIKVFQKLYFFLALLSNIFCVYHAIREPFRPVYPFFYIEKEDFNRVYHGGYTVFQMLMIAWCWVGYIVLEGICCFFATVFIQCMSTLMGGIDCTFINIAKQHQQQVADSDDYTETPVPQKKDLTVTVEMLLRNAKNAKTLGSPFQHIVEMSQISKEEYLIFVVRKLQTIASLQSKINSIIGPLLLFDVGQLVLLSCALTFLPVKFTFALDIDSSISFIGNGIAVFARLIILMVCLGNVFSKGQDVNAALAKAMTTSSLSTECQNPILAHLSVYSANPICFTAWGFFNIQRGTLLAAFSLISTYAVVFFQIKG